MRYWASEDDKIGEMSPEKGHRDGMQPHGIETASPTNSSAESIQKGLSTGGNGKAVQNLGYVFPPVKCNK